MPTECAVSGCGTKVWAHGFCPSHLARWLKHGDPLKGRIRNGETDRFINEVVLKQEDRNCLIWPYAKMADGYGNIRKSGKNLRVHRLICEAVNGPPPSIYHEAAHSCGNGHLACVSMHHLSWKTLKENDMDKDIHGSRRGRQTHAPL